jgi:hypothetical protein
VNLYAKLIPQVLLARDSVYKNILWDRRDPNYMQILRSDLTEHGEGGIELPVSVTPVTIPMGGVTTGAILMILSSQSVNVFLNSSVTAIPLVPSGVYPGLLLLHGSFTGLTVVNLGTSVASLEYLIVGV